MLRNQTNVIFSNFTKC